MDVDMIKQAERFGEFVKYYNAYYEFGKFKEALLSKNNQKTENTSLVKYLKKLLLQADSETPPGMDIVPSDKIYFRARKIEDIFDATEKGITFNDNSIISGYNYFESKEPPIGIARDGRNNYVGSSYLYLSDDPYTACVEIRPTPFSFISVASFKVKEMLHIVDFSKTFSYEDGTENYSVNMLMNLIPLMYSSPVINSEDYYATQYISDLIRKYGFDGIAYRSSISEGIDYTIFNCSDKYIEFISSEVIMCDDIDHNFYRFNSLDKIDKNDSHETNAKERLEKEKSEILRAAKKIQIKKVKISQYKELSWVLVMRKNSLISKFD